MSPQPYPVGTRIEKINSNSEDMHQDGERGYVVFRYGSLTPGTTLGNGEVIREPEWGYFVKWENFPLPVFIRGKRIREVKA